MTPAPSEPTVRPLTGADELGLFRRLSYVLDHELAAQDGVERIRAATDLGDVPMATSFARLGHVTFERAFDMVGDH